MLAPSLFLPAHGFSGSKSKCSRWSGGVHRRRVPGAVAESAVDRALGNSGWPPPRSDAG